MNQPVLPGAASLYQQHIAPQEFAARRAKVFDQIGSDACAILQGAIPLGEFHRFRQDDEFYYLCGVQVPYALLLLDGRNRTTVLYLPGRNESLERSEGAILNSDEASVTLQLTGVDEVRKPEALADDLANAATIYAPHRHLQPGAPADAWPQPIPRRTHFMEQIKACAPNAEIEDLSPILDVLRMVKSPAELRLMRKAGALTALAVLEAMRCTRPGIMEYQLGAVADFVYLNHGASGGAYRPIIGGGGNAWYGHYYRNDAALQDGDLVLMDYAPDYGNYTSDIGRMWPVNGTYAPWQRELYGFMIEYHKVLLSCIHPGRLADDIHREAAETMQSVLAQTKFSKPCYEQAAQRALEFQGHLSHTVGLAVHDGGRYRATPLVPGIVFSVDPQMWIPEEKLYIRVEDTVVVTESGIENLTVLAPLEMDDVEAAIRQKGVL